MNILIKVEANPVQMSLQCLYKISGRGEFKTGLLQTIKVLCTAKKGKTVTPSKTLQAKGEMCTLQTGKLCYSTININYVLVLVKVQNCKRAQSLICRGPS